MRRLSLLLLLAEGCAWLKTSLREDAAAVPGGLTLHIQGEEHLTTLTTQGARRVELPGHDVEPGAILSGVTPKLLFDRGDGLTLCGFTDSTLSCWRLNAAGVLRPHPVPAGLAPFGAMDDRPLDNMRIQPDGRWCSWDWITKDSARFRWGHLDESEHQTRVEVWQLHPGFGGIEALVATSTHFLWTRDRRLYRQSIEGGAIEGIEAGEVLGLVPGPGPGAVTLLNDDGLLVVRGTVITPLLRSEDVATPLAWDPSARWFAFTSTAGNAAPRQGFNPIRHGPASRTWLYDSTTGTARPLDATQDITQAVWSR